MNFKSRILKLSILFMLVLVLLPAIAAEDSSEAFFIEYEDPNDEVIVEETDSIEEMNQAQVDVSPSSEVADDIEVSSQDTPVQDQSEIEESDEDTNIIIIPEQAECSVVETHDVVEENNDDEKITDLYCENVVENINHNNCNDVNEDSGCEQIIDDISIINQGSIINSEISYNNLIVVSDVYMEANCFKTNSFKRSLTKVLELKNNLLINNDIRFIFADNLADNVDGDVIICADKITTDFVFSIDNSVIGDENLIFFVTTSYCFNLNPCFNASISCDFLVSNLFFGGDFDCC